MIIRSFRLSDHACVNRLLSEVLTADCYEETIDALANQLSLDSGLILVAEVDQQVVGVIIGTVDDNKGYYYRLAIDVSHRNRGIGRTLIRHLDKRFQNRKVNKIMIALDRHNEHLRSFYESLGYQAKDFMSGIASLRIVNG
ncbi:hypothetical protein PRECH8_12480 [Insulibacter thermoxylanivorax]|uniref:N-acetyltransferase domain-containing protein n=1 Tax=Insulibacter thermoxylanivorax TaxID=2749268 RepID=A0A916QC03_9BACL|nr:hypothetical protein PRECH8_12480 [Insulibacter thermoxylanivorax]